MNILAMASRLCRHPGLRRDDGFQKRLSLSLLLFFLATTISAKVRVETSLEPREATVGDVLTLQVKTVLEGAGSCGLDVGKRVGPFEVLHFSTGHHRRNGNLVEQDFQLNLTLFDVGVSTLPALTVHCQENGQRTDVKTPEIPVTIKSVLTPQSKDIHGLKGRLKKVPNWPVIGALAGVLLLVGGLVWWFRFRPGKGGIRPPGPPPVAPHVRALEDLRRLEEEMESPAKVFFSRLTDILRMYLEGAFRLPATDRTTAEIFGGVEVSFPSAWINGLGLRTVLEDGDLAKFAKLEPTVGRTFERISSGYGILFWRQNRRRGRRGGNPPLKKAGNPTALPKRHDLFPSADSLVIDSCSALGPLRFSLGVCGPGKGLLFVALPAGAGIGPETFGPGHSVRVTAFGGQSPHYCVGAAAKGARTAGSYLARHGHRVGVGSFRQHAQFGF
jgi:hypothetical protein